MFLTACQSSNGPPDLRATAVVTPTTFQAGTPVAVKVTVTNHGSIPRQIETFDCPPPFEVKTGSGEIVGPGDRNCSAVSIPRDLTPGEQHIFEIPWSGDGKGQGSGPESNILLPPGTYFLQAIVGAVGGPVRSDPVQITVTP